MSSYPISDLTLNRWSPRSMTGEEISEKELFSLFEATRWAPSSYNNQPWRFIYGKRGTPHFERLFDTGAAWQNMALEGSIRGLVVHGMEGFFYEQAKKHLSIPDDYEIEAMIEMEKKGPKANLKKKSYKKKSSLQRETL